MPKAVTFLFLLSSLFSSSSAFSETFNLGEWRYSSSAAALVEGSTIDGDGNFTIRWSNPALAYDEGFKVYHLSPSDTRYQFEGTIYSTSIDYSGLEMGVHRFAIECICYDDEDYGDVISKWGRLTVEIGEAATIVPKYKIVSIIYAPPGTQNNGSASSISYADSSSLGSSTSASESFVRGHYVEIKNEVSGLFDSFSITNTYSGSKANWSEEVIEIKKNVTQTLMVEGSRVGNGVNHNYDQIVLWLRPRIEIFNTPSASRWSFEQNQEVNLQYVYVGHLRNPSLMPSGTAAELASAGITEDIYSEILAAYPFEYEDAPLDLERFKYVSTLSYQPPYAPGDATNVSTLNLSFQSNTVSASSTTVKKSYSVQVEAGFGVTKLWDIKSKLKTEWTWTDVDSRKNLEGTSESVTATIRGPSYGYTGPTAIKVYYDVIYKTFAFVPL